MTSYTVVTKNGDEFTYATIERAALEAAAITERSRSSVEVVDSTDRVVYVAVAQ